MLQFKSVSLARDGKQLLNNADLIIHAGQKVGLVGANGAGKTSLMLLILGKLQADGGEWSLPKQIRVAHLQQEIPQTELSATDFVIGGDTLYQEVKQGLQAAEDAGDGMAIAEWYMRFDEIHGYAVESKAAKIMHGLGFSSEEQQRAVKSFSGGWQMRLNLARLLMTRADLLLLDEPTNHLDLEAIVWLEAWLRDCEQTIILISHDRDFLDNVVTHIVHLHQQQLKNYTGNYSHFEVERATQLALQQALYEKQQAMRAHLQSYVDRFRYKATKARQAQSRLKMLNRMEMLSAVHLENPFRFEFKSPKLAGNPMITLDKVDLGYGQHTILTGLNQAVRDGDRIGLIGPNGAGKSTLIKFLAGQTQALAGEVHRSTKIQVGYFSQHQLELLHPQETPLQHLVALERYLQEAQARQYLGGFGFSNNDVFRPVSTFSGGEKARLVLALIIWQAPNLLLLDEPTNHLDLEMREALSLALQAYEGALVVVSHDRHLLNSVTNELWLVADGVVRDFAGSLEEYQQVISKARREPTPKAAKPAVVAKKMNVTQWTTARDKQEALVTKLHATLASCDEQLAASAPGAAGEAAQWAKLLEQRETLLKQIAEAEERLLDLYGQEPG